MALLTRNYCRGLAEETLKIIEDKSYQNLNGDLIDISSELAYSQKETLYIPQTESLETLLSERNKNTIYENPSCEVINLTSLDAVRQLISEGEENIAVLNFASGKNPGGGFLGGSKAQEESLCRASGLYSCLIDNGIKYYEDNRRIKPNLGVYTDGIIYSPKVPVFRSENGELMHSPVFASFITIPAVNASVYRKRTGEKSKEIIKKEIEIIMKRRMFKLLELFRLKNHSVIVLGAWGCGAFGNDTNDIANLINDCLNTEPYNKCFKRIIVAIYDGSNRSKNLPIFEKVFN